MTILCDSCESPLPVVSNSEVIQVITALQNGWRIMILNSDEYVICCSEKCMDSFEIDNIEFIVDQDDFDPE